MRLNTTVETTNEVVMCIDKQTKDWKNVGDAQCPNTQRVSLLEEETTARTLAVKNNDNVLLDMQQRLKRYAHRLGTSSSTLKTCD